MILLPILVLVGVCFYLFIGLGPIQLIQIMLAGLWFVALLSIPAGLIYDLLR